MSFNKFHQTLVAISGFCLLISGTAFGATVEAGNAITSWLGKGEIYGIGKDCVLFHGALDVVNRDNKLSLEGGYRPKGKGHDQLYAVWLSLTYNLL
ncbi:hypothetical protein [Candidatus Nitrospira salsa]